VFNPSRLTLARQRRGWTKKQLAAAAGVDDRSISAYEAAESVPSAATMGAIATALGFPIEFFSGIIAEVLPADAASFRALSKMTASQRNSALAAGELAVMLNGWIESRFVLPPLDVPDLSGETPEMAAESIRAQWGQGVRPIKNMVHLLEAHGVRVYSLAEECREVDAFSIWRAGVPYVFLNTMKSGERSRFDAAHELGHLVLHRHGDSRGRPAEMESNAFAASLLMPRASMMTIPSGVTSVAGLVRLKANWNVSVGALAHRMFEVGLLTEWNYRAICIQSSQLGYRTDEPDSISRETSKVLATVFAGLREEGIGLADIARDLHLLPQEIQKLVFDLVPSPMPVVVQGGGEEAQACARPIGRPQLRLVHGQKRRR